MQDRIAKRRRVKSASFVALVARVFFVGIFLAGCSASVDNPLTIFADPGKYQYNTCEQLASQRKHWSGREQELKLLMDKAEQNAGGTIVNVLAYKADHVAAAEELQVLEGAARSKNCDNPANWRSNSVVR
jgi:hypothetical protein